MKKILYLEIMLWFIAYLVSIWSTTIPKNDVIYYGMLIIVTYITFDLTEQKN